MEVVVKNLVGDDACHDVKTKRVEMGGLLNENY